MEVDRDAAEELFVQIMETGKKEVGADYADRLSALGNQLIAKKKTCLIA